MSVFSIYLSCKIEKMWHLTFNSLIFPDSLEATNLFSTSMCLNMLDCLNNWDCTVFVFQCLAFFTQHKTFSFLNATNNDLLPFKRQIIFYCVTCNIFFIHSPVDGCLFCFSLLKSEGVKFCTIIILPKFDLPFY